MTMDIDEQVPNAEEYSSDDNNIDLQPQQPQIDESINSAKTQAKIQCLTNHSGTFWNTNYDENTNLKVLKEINQNLNQLKRKYNVNDHDFQQICNAAEYKLHPEKYNQYIEPSLTQTRIWNAQKQVNKHIYYPPGFTPKLDKLVLCSDDITSNLSDNINDPSKLFILNRYQSKLNGIIESSILIKQKLTEDAAYCQQAYARKD